MSARCLSRLRPARPSGWSDCVAPATTPSAGRSSGRYRWWQAIWPGTPAVDSRSPADAMRNQIGFVSSRRAEESIAANMAVRENIYLNPVCNRENVLQIISRRGERTDARAALKRFRSRRKNRTGRRDAERRQSAEGRRRTLDGGGRPIAGAGRADHRRRCKLQGGNLSPAPALIEQGMAVLLISSDFEEVERICHRALVFSRGQVVAEIPRDELTIANLTARASGGTAATSTRRTGGGA